MFHKIYIFWLIPDFPKMEKVNVVFHKHNRIIEYKYGKNLKIMSLINSSNSILTQAIKFYGYENKDKLFIIDGFMKNPFNIFSNGKLQSTIKNR